MAMRIDVLTLFPEMFPPIFGTSIPARAETSGAVEYHVHDLRNGPATSTAQSMTGHSVEDQAW